MDAEKIKRWKELADLIAIEQDGERFSALIAELTRLLEDEGTTRLAPKNAPSGMLPDALSGIES